MFNMKNARALCLPNILYWILIFYMFFNEILTKSIFENITILKYLIILYLFFYIIHRTKYSAKNIYSKPLKVFYVYIVIISILTISNWAFTLSGIGAYKNLLILPLSIYIFSFYENITGKSRDDLMTLIVKMAVAHVLINTFLYFYEIPIWKVFHPYWGRISQGYPTVDVVLLNFSLAILLIYKGLKFKTLIKILFAFILVIGILLLASGTGIVMMTIVFALSILIPILQRRYVKNIKTTIVTLILLLISFSSAVQIIKNVDESLYESMYLSLQNRMSILLGQESELDINTMDIRKERRSDIKKMQTDDFDVLFGRGFSNLNMNPEIRNVPGTIFLEDQYSVNLLTIGVIGALMFLVCFAIEAIKAIKQKRELIAVIILLFIISSFTSGCLINFSISLFVGIFLQRPQISMYEYKLKQKN